MSVLGDLGRLLSGQVTAGGRKLTYGRIDNVVGWRAYDAAQTSGMGVAKPGETYFRWYVQELWQRVERKWLAEYQPLVSSSTRLRFGSSDLEIPVTLGELSAGFSDQVVGGGNSLMLNLPITPALPYDGGDVELAVALVGVKTSDGVTDLIGAVRTLGSALVVPQLSAVAACAAAARDADGAR